MDPNVADIHAITESYLYALGLQARVEEAHAIALVGYNRE